MIYLPNSRIYSVHVRDESFITSWGAGYIQGWGVGNFFGDVLGGGGLKIKWPMGRGGSCISSGMGGGSDVFHWSFFSLKVIASGGRSSPPPPPTAPLYPSSIMWHFLNHWATLEIKYALFLLNNNLFLQISPSSFSAFNNNHYHQC